MPLLTHNDLRLSERRIVIPRLPAAFHNVRIVQISDLHFYEYSDPHYFDRVAREVNALQPDVIALTGDVVHYGDQHIADAAQFLARLEARAARLAIVGNHDYQDGAGSHRILAMLQGCGFQVLRNEHVCLTRSGADGTADRLWFAGLDDIWYGVPDIAQALAGVPNDAEATVMLAHNPLLFDPIALGAQGPVDLVIAGHTHAGHVYIPVLGPIYRKIFRMKYRYGLFAKNGCQLHVTSGVGSAAFYLKKRRIGLPRFRFNTHPEIAVLTLLSE